MFGHKWFLKIGELSNSSISGLTKDANELINCSIAFHQGIDHKGQAQTGVYVGDIILTYDGLPSNEIIYWAMTPIKLHSGALVLCDANDIPLEKIFFEDGVCVGMSLNYTKDGKSPAVTQLRLQARKIISGEETLTQHWSKIASSSNDTKKQSNQAKAEIFKIFQPIGKISLRLQVENNAYEVDSFSLSFSQGIDFKGEPQEETKGGLIDFSIGSLPDRVLKRWMLKDTELKDGEFVFEQGDQSSPLRVRFTEAFCVHMATRTSMGEGLYTQYTISANEVDLNGKWLYRSFKL